MAHRWRISQTHAIYRRVYFLSSTALRFITIFSSSLSRFNQTPFFFAHTNIEVATCLISFDSNAILQTRCAANTKITSSDFFSISKIIKLDRTKLVVDRVLLNLQSRSFADWHFLNLCIIGPDLNFYYVCKFVFS